MRPVETVSSYPRPPLIELVSGSVEIWIAGQQIAHDRSAPFSVFSAAPQINRTATVLLMERSYANPAHESRAYQGRHSHPALT